MGREGGKTGEECHERDRSSMQIQRVRHEVKVKKGVLIMLQKRMHRPLPPERVILKRLSGRK